MNCKPGDMAVIVRSQYFPQEVGLLVEVVEFKLRGSRFVDPDGVGYKASEDAWLIKYMGTPQKAQNGQGIARFAMWLDSCLRPIRPGELEDETTTSRARSAA
jgi:hypothetical protein